MIREPMAVELHEHVNRIHQLTELDKNERAVKEAKKALEDFPDSYALYFLMGHAYMKMDRNQDAKRCLKESLKLEPLMAITHEKLAVLYHDEDNAKKAEEHITRSIELDPESASAFATASIIYADSAPIHAARYLKKAQSLDNQDEATKIADAHRSLISFKFGRLRKQIKQKMSENPDSDEIKELMAYVEISHGHYHSAESLLRDAYVADPKEKILDAWIDSRLAKFFPFNWLIRFHALAYNFSLGLQIYPFMLFVFFGWLISMSAVQETNETWPWIPHIIVASYLSTIYLFKYPIQLLFRLKHHPEISIWTFRNAQKLALSISLICYWILIGRIKEGVYLNVIAFLLIYVPMWRLVLDRKYWITRLPFLFLYFLAWISFLVSLIIDLLEIDSAKFIGAPAVFGWALILVFVDAANKYEIRRAELE